MSYVPSVGESICMAVQGIRVLVANADHAFPRMQDDQPIPMHTRKHSPIAGQAYSSIAAPGHAVLLRAVSSGVLCEALERPSGRTLLSRAAATCWHHCSEAADSH